MYWVTIQHLPSKTYLTTNSSGALSFTNEIGNACMFGVWKKYDSVVGLQNRLTRKWLGQTFFGSIVCSASSFSSREEWEVSLSISILHFTFHHHILYDFNVIDVSSTCSLYYI